MKKITSLLIAVVMILTMAIGTLTASAAPINNELEIGKTYTMSLTQANLEGKVLYFDGTMNGYYFNGNEDASKAVVLTVEAAEGGIRFSFTDNGAKKYIDVVKKGNYINVVITDAPTAVFKYNVEATTYVVDIEGTDYYIGTYNTFSTFSASKISYITGDNAAKVGVSQFPAVFTAVGSAPVAPEAPETTVAPETTAAPETTEAPAVESTPLLEGGILADFSSFVADEEGGKDTSYISRTNADGWKVTGARSDTAAYTGGIPMITLNGKTSAPGTLTSSVIKGGIDKLAFNYGFAFTDTQFSLTINVKKADGTVIKSEKLEKTDLTKETVYSYTLDVNTTEDVIIEIVNNCLTGTDKNKDRLGIWNLTWTQPEAPQTTEPGASSETGDNTVFFVAAALAVVAIAGTAVIGRKHELD